MRMQSLTKITVYNYSLFKMRACFIICVIYVYEVNDKKNYLTVTVLHLTAV
jgi:hypothetical protein